MDNNFFNKEDLKNAVINNKKLDGMKVTLKYTESENIGLLSAIGEDGKIYVLRMERGGKYEI